MSVDLYNKEKKLFEASVKKGDIYGWYGTGDRQ